MKTGQRRTKQQSFQQFCRQHGVQCSKNSSKGQTARLIDLIALSWYDERNIASRVSIFTTRWTSEQTSILLILIHSHQCIDIFWYKDLVSIENLNPPPISNIIASQNHTMTFQMRNTTRKYCCVLGDNIYGVCFVYTSDCVIRSEGISVIPCLFLVSELGRIRHVAS